MRYRYATKWIMAATLIAPAFGSTVYLGSADIFGLLGGTISNTGTSTVLGDVGGVTSVTGFNPTGTATGTVFSGGPTVTAAYSDFQSAYGTAALATSTEPSVLGLGTNQSFLGGGVYAFSSTNVTSTAGITLQFDGQSDNNAVFILQIQGALTIDGPITFNLVNGAQADNIYWIVGAGATINPSVGQPVTFDGNILADTFTMSAIPGGSGSLAGTINGCVLTTNANTLAGTTIVNGCASSNNASVPEPGTASLLILGGLASALLIRRQ